MKWRSPPLKKALAAEGAQAKIVAPHLGKLKGAKGAEVDIDFSLLTSASVLFDALYIPGGAASALAKEPEALQFIRDAFKHCKAIGANLSNADLLRSADKSLEMLLEKPLEKDPGSNARVFSKHGVTIGQAGALKDLLPEFILAMGEDRHWIREADRPL